MVRLVRLVRLVETGKKGKTGTNGKTGKTGKTGMTGGLANERRGTDHVISGPMRGLEKNCMGRGQHSTHGNCNAMKDPAQRAESVKIHYISYSNL